MPTTLVLVSQLSDTRDRELARARAETHQAAALVAAGQANLLESIRATVATFALTNRARAPLSDECDELAAEVVAATPILQNISVALSDGSIPCSGISLPEGLNVSDRGWFARVRDEQRFIVGDFIISRADGKPTIAAAVPVFAVDGTLVGFAAAGVDLTGMSELLKVADLPSGAAATVVDSSGIIVARWPDPESWIGKTVPDSPLVAAILSGAAGADSLVGVDGVERVYAFAQVGDPAASSLRVSVGVSRDTILEPIEATFQASMTALLGASVVATALALLGIRLLVLRPVGRLIGATRRVEAGDLTARAGNVGGGEVGELAGTFDSMAVALERRTHDLEATVVARTSDLVAALDEARDLYEQAPVGYHSLDPEGRVARVNATELAWLGYDQAFMIGRPFSEFLTDEGRQQFAVEFPAFLESGTVHDLRYDLVRADGSRLPVRLSATAVRDAGGRFLQSRTVVEDISERQQAEQWSAELFDSFSSPVTIYDPVRDETGAVVDYVRVYVNPRTATLLGRPLDALLGTRIRTTPRPGDPINVVVEALTRVLETGVPEALPDLEVLDAATGQQVILALQVNRLGSRVAQVSRDVTLDRTAEREVTAAREAAEAADRAKTEFLARMSHELRTPLNAIIGFGQLLELDHLPARQHEAVSQILRGGRHLLELINEVLDISRIEAGQLSISTEPVSLAKTIGDLVELIEPIASERGVHVDATALPGGAYVMADRHRLRQVVLNILSNAVKYNRPDGTITLTALGVEGPQGERHLRVNFTDQGRGIDPAMIERVFAPFDRLGEERGGVEGTGLGLALCKALIEAMGGRIGVESTPGIGSTFWISLPLTVTPTLAEPASGTPEPATAVASGPLKTLLYIEDNPSNFLLVERALERRPGYRLLAAMLGQLGIDLAREHRPDVVLLDLHLPDISGEDVLGQLRADPATRDMAIIVLSAEASSKVRDRLMALGATDYLAKPIDLAEFYRVVDAAAMRGPAAGA